MDRDEKRRLLRQKIANRKNERTGGGTSSTAPPVAQTIRNDMTSALLAMGIDDAHVLTQMSQLAKNPEALKQASKTLKEASKRESREEGASSDEEEAPPPP